MDAELTWGNSGDAPSCALLGGFAIGARIALPWQHSANAKCQRVLVLALCLVYTVDELAPPPVLAHVWCGQTAGWIKMSHGTEVGLGPGHMVLDGDPAPPAQKGNSPQFSAKRQD